MMRFASLPGDLLDSLCGDFITEDLGQVLASVCGHLKSYTGMSPTSFWRAYNSAVNFRTSPAYFGSW